MLKEKGRVHNVCPISIFDLADQYVSVTSGDMLIVSLVMLEIYT